MPLALGSTPIIRAYLGAIPIAAIRLGAGPNLLPGPPPIPFKAPAITSLLIEDLTPVVGQTLTAIAAVDLGVPDADLNWQWTVIDPPVTDAPVITSVTINDLTPQVGQVLSATAQVSDVPAGYSWTWTTLDGVAPTISSVTIDRTAPQVGQTLTAFANVTGAGSVSWTWIVLSTAPIVTVISAATDTTPELALDLTNPQSGDTVTVQIAGNTGFTTALQPYTETLDPSELSAYAVNFGIASLANGTWYVRANHTQDDVVSPWSNPVVLLIAAPDVPLTFSLSPSSVLDIAPPGTIVGTVSGAGSNNTPHLSVYALGLPGSIEANAPTGSTVGTVSP